MNTAIAPRPVGSTFGGYGLTSIPVGPYRNHYISAMCPFFEEPEAGAGDEGGDYGEVEIDDESQEPDATTGARPKIKVMGFKNPEARVMLPGMTKPISLKDLQGAFGQRTQYEAGMKTLGEIATLLKKDGGKPQKQQQAVRPEGKVTQTEAKNALERLESMDLLDGKTMAAALRDIETSTLTPLVKTVVAMAKELKEMRGHVGSFRQRDSETAFGGEIRSAISALKLPRDGDKPIEGEEILSEMVRDMFLSYDEEDQPKLTGEVLSKLVKSRHDSIMKYAKAYQKAELAAAQKRAREMRFPRPGGQVSANGKPKKVLTNRAAADLLFAGSGSEA